MKKFLSIFAIALMAVFSFSACDCDDPSDSDTSAGGTKTKKMNGNWLVSVYYCENPGDTTAIDTWEWIELGSFGNPLLTYNTAANKSTEMWVDDEGECYLGSTEDYTHKVKVNVNYGKRTFSVSNAANEYSDNTITIIGGKVLEKAATNSDGVKEDSIVYYVKASNTSYGYLKVSGYRNNI